jgi:hypothetical protein
MIPFPNLWRKESSISVWFLVGRKPWNIELPRQVNFAAVRDGAFV